MTKDEAEALTSRYTARPVTFDHGLHGWKYLDVDIFLDETRVGSYRRNYPEFYDTFLPFVQCDGAGGFHVLALYSPDYSAARVMRLPDCIDVGGEELHRFGFCPISFFVPYDPECGLTGNFGFVAGCIWGDDSSWKIQYLDLTNVVHGTLLRDERFGYCALPSKDTKLRDVINLKSYRSDDEYGFVDLTTTRTFRLKQSQWDDPFE